MGTVFKISLHDKECIGNKIHACAIKYVNDTVELMEFFNEFTDLEGEEDIDEIIEVAQDVRIMIITDMPGLILRL